MNYYEHHLGDYAKDTTSLTMLEEGAYRRLIDVYYSKELPLPSDIAKVCKAARAISRSEKEAVKSVLVEFFTLTPEGYRHKRCDEEIERYQISQEGSDAKRENDKIRQERARERRKALFEQLRSHGIVAPWDAKTHELETHLSRVTKTKPSRNVTRDESELVTRDNTATQTPVPSTHTQKPNKEKRAEALVVPPWVPPEAWAGYVEMRRKGKKPMTDRAMRLKFGELNGFKEAGHDLTTILDKSTSNNWTDLYEPKTPPNGGKQNRHPQWALNAGFPNVDEAGNSLCYERNAHEFRDGIRIQEVIA
jgi:uncharacterized protein YdaU (DUF1376 family)